MPKILLIEDDASLRDSLADMLKGEGYEVAEAEDGEKGVEIVKNNLFDVIVSDLRTPTMTALSLIRQLGERARGAGIIIMTGHGSELTEKISKEINVSAYIKKPFSPPQLLSVIEDILKDKGSIA